MGYRTYDPEERKSELYFEVFFLFLTFLVIVTLAILSWPARLGALAVCRQMLP